METNFSGEPNSNEEGRFDMGLSEDERRAAVESFEETEEAEDERRIGKFKVKEFEEELLPGETEEERTGRYRLTQERRVAVAFSEGAEALLAPDFDFNGESEAEREELTAAVTERYEWIGGLDEEGFRKETGRVLREIETPMTEEGAEAVYEKLKGDNLALRMVYALTAGEAWTAEEAPGDLDEEGQKQLGVRVLGAFFGKYGNAAEFRGAKQEFLEAVKDVPEYQEKMKSGEMEEALENLVWEMYGEQEEWMEVAEDVREKGRRLREVKGEMEELERKAEGILEEIAGVSDKERIAEIEKATGGRVKVEEAQDVQEASDEGDVMGEAEENAEGDVEEDAEGAIEEDKGATEPKSGERKVATGGGGRAYRESKARRGRSYFVSDMSLEDSERTLRQMGLI